MSDSRRRHERRAYFAGSAEHQLLCDSLKIWRKHGLSEEVRASRKKGHGSGPLCGEIRSGEAAKTIVGWFCGCPRPVDIVSPFAYRALCC